ncbi:MAG: SDR family NAD(P)-dependent oxidoreductase [Candidatus Heimdallarchaeaceae archaeon]
MSKKMLDGPILITGSNTGIGRKTLELLTSKGLEVYAGARKEKDLEELDKLHNTTAIKLDVTKPEEIQQAVSTINKLGKGLYGLVNNAGIANVGPIFTHSEEAMYEMFDINVFGIHRVTNAMLPFLFKSKGRIVNISSISGILTAPFFGLYSMGKHAVEAYSDALYVNLRKDGIEVSIIEPGNFKSEIGKSMYRRRIEEKDDLRIFMKPSHRKMQLKEMKEQFDGPDTNPEPVAVAEAIYDALYSEQPKPRYLVTGNQEESRWVIKRMLFEMKQMNMEHEFSYSRDELVELLDLVLEEQEFSFE